MENENHNNEHNNMTEKQVKLNPWFSIWIKPRATMRSVLNNKPGKVFLLIYLGMLVNSLDQASTRDMGDTYSMSTVLFASIVFPLFTGIIYYYLAPTIFRWAGSILNGHGTTEEVRYALAYSFIPYVYSLIIVWLPSLLLFGKENFTYLTPNIDNSPILFALLLLLLLIDLVIACWTIIISLKCLGEAHQFSAWRALGASIIAFLIIFVPLLLIGLAIVPFI
ncbi:Yip1 family protein [Chengkuizengella axinellae]|uniref:Yip1 family protein n=1 Tax=Chengkuizengella axinellae TaxID=3064388 RepID=A0ABT9J635_9BACL|nr:Yip1 family protein [Chengkuizengella sp. 2205SS18-9]MDP5277077.1 Yip1 family protein [Chengkuizengella sp. 2205SS18-9]